MQSAIEQLIIEETWGTRKCADRTRVVHNVARKINCICHGKARKAKKLLLHQEISTAQPPLQVDLCINAAWWRNRGFARGSNGKRSGRLSQSRARKCFSNSKEPSNLFRGWCLVKTLFNLLTPSQFMALNSRLSSWTFERRKAAKMFDEVVEALFPFTLQRERREKSIFSTLLTAQQAKQNLYMEKLNFNSGMWTGMRVLQCIQLEKILLHNRCSSDFLMQLYLAQGRKIEMAERRKNALLRYWWLSGFLLRNNFFLLFSFE